MERYQVEKLITSDSYGKVYEGTYKNKAAAVKKMQINNSINKKEKEIVKNTESDIKTFQ